MKRNNNTTGLKIKYIGATDTKENRIKFTQLNNDKSVTVSYNHKFDTLGLAVEILNRIELDEAMEADMIFDVLMGEKVEPRREFIQENAKYVTDLDI